MKQRIMWVLWPAFLMAAVSEMLFFAFIDPGEVVLFGNPVTLSASATYSLFFFFFWTMATCSSALTCFLQRSPFELNRCPLDAPDRPQGCPKRANGSC